MTARPADAARSSHPAPAPSRRGPSEQGPSEQGPSEQGPSEHDPFVADPFAAAAVLTIGPDPGEPGEEAAAVRGPRRADRAA